jgi:hypothetical protein
MCFIDPKSINLKEYKEPDIDTAMAIHEMKGPQRKISNDSCATLVSGMSRITGLSGLSKTDINKRRKKGVTVNYIVEEETEDADEIARREECENFDIKGFKAEIQFHEK